MTVEVKMPQLGESVFEGTIGQWLKSEGDSVEKYEPLLEVVTDKVDTEVTAIEGGTLLRILVPEGETVKVGTVLALIGEAGEAVDYVVPEDGAAQETAGAQPAGATGAAEPEAVTPRADRGPQRVSPVAARMIAEHGLAADAITGTGRNGQVTRDDVERHLAAPEAATASPSPAATPTPSPAARGAIGFISPRVARLAAEQGVDLRRVEGTGRDGRITARDVERFAASGAAETSPSRPATAARGKGAVATEIHAGDLIPLTPVRRSIAEHMVRSLDTSPHVSTIHEVDMSAVVAAYRSMKESYSAKGTRLTFTSFIVQATAMALAEHPLVNSSWTDDGIQTHRDVNVGIAVAAPQGLIVPVIRKADEKSLLGITREINELAEKARSRQLSPDDVQGGTFTITNYGVFGGLIGTPIISQPQAAILGTGAIKKRAVVIEGPEGDAIGIRSMMFLSLTFDHRILDGATADPFVQNIVARLEGYRA